MAPPPDMFLFGCASLDLLAEVINPTVRLRNMSLTGYLNTRQYMTAARDRSLRNIHHAGSGPYRRIRSPLRTAGVLRLLLRGSRRRLLAHEGPAARNVPRQDRGALLKTKDVTIERAAARRQGRRRPNDEAGERNLVQPTAWSPQRYEWVSDDRLPAGRTVKSSDLVLALPPKPLARLVRRGKRGRRIVDALPDLAELARVGSQRVPMLHLASRETHRTSRRSPSGCPARSSTSRSPTSRRLWTKRYAASGAARSSPCPARNRTCFPVPPPTRAFNVVRTADRLHRLQARSRKGSADNIPVEIDVHPAGHWGESAHTMMTELEDTSTSSRGRSGATPPRSTGRKPAST